VDRDGNYFPSSLLDGFKSKEDTLQEGPFGAAGESFTHEEAKDRFNFGDRSGDDSVSGGFSFGNESAAAAGDAASSGFSFGGKSPPQDSVPAGFSFGDKSPPPPQDSIPGGFSFGDKSPAAASDDSVPGGFSFGEKSPGDKSPAGDAAPSGFSFGNESPAGDDAPSGFSFGENSPGDKSPAGDAAPSGFLFGNKSPQDAAPSGFPFGNNFKVDDGPLLKAPFDHLRSEPEPRIDPFAISSPPGSLDQFRFGVPVEERVQGFPPDGKFHGSAYFVEQPEHCLMTDEEMKMMCIARSDPTKNWPPDRFFHEAIFLIASLDLEKAKTFLARSEHPESGWVLSVLNEATPETLSETFRNAGSGPNGRGKYILARIICESEGHLGRLGTPAMIGTFYSLIIFVL
jgi:hypothetical protein